jgi:CDP-diacylglycerol--glycerol-3-phosphate 3-phosphatidyltransferase
MNIAIALTGSRLLFGPLFAAAFIRAMRPETVDLAWLWGAIACVVAIEITDALDGVMARSRGQVTDFGKIFDPICDSLSRQTVLISFMVVGIIPLWMFLIFLYRDGLMSFVRVMCAASGTVVAARKSGKIKAIFQAIGIALALLIVLLRAYGVAGVPAEIAGRHPAFWILLFPALFTALSLFDYIIPNWRVFERAMRPKA